VSTGELVVRIVEALAWPVMALAGVVLLRKPIAAWLERDPPSRVKAGPLELEWDRVAAKTEEAVKAELDGHLPTSTAGDNMPRIAEELAPAVEQTPFVAIEEAYVTLERELRQTVGSVEGVDTLIMRPVGLARLGGRLGRINPDVIKTVEGLSVMRNLAAHGRGPEITSERAREYVTLVDAALNALRSGPTSRRPQAPPTALPHPRSSR
jgi:hypothetical protein